MRKTAYGKRISDWSSDVCSSDLSATQRHKIERTRGGRDNNSRSRNPQYGLREPCAGLERHAGTAISVGKSFPSRRAATDELHLPLPPRAVCCDYHMSDRKSTRLNSSH